MARVELLVIDEMHHLVRSDKAGRTAWEVTEALKNLARAGVCPIAIVGVDRARNLVNHELNAQFTSRCDVPVFLTPLDIAVGKEREMFAGFVQALNIAMVKHGLFDCSSEPTQGDWMSCVYDVSAGVMGWPAGCSGTPPPMRSAGTRRASSATASGTPRDRGPSRSGSPTETRGPPKRAT